MATLDKTTSSLSAVHSNSKEPELDPYEEAKLFFFEEMREKEEEELRKEALRAKQEGTGVFIQTGGDVANLKRVSIHQMSLTVPTLRPMSKATTMMTDETELNIESPMPEDVTLEELYIRACHRNNAVPISFFKHSVDSCTEFRLSSLALTDKDIVPLCIALAKSEYVESLDLSGNFMDRLGLKNVLNLVRSNSSLVSLDISGNSLGSMGAKMIADEPHYLYYLEKLNISNNKFTGSDAPYIETLLLHCANLKSLDISHNDFNSDSGMTIASGIKGNYVLLELNISWNNFGGRGAQAVALALRENGNLEKVDASWNGISDVGVAILASGLDNHVSLKSIDLSANRIGIQGALYLSKALSTNDMLEEINLSFNPLTTKGTEQILIGIIKNENSKLKLLNVSNCSVTYDTVALLKEHPNPPKLICNTLVLAHDKQTETLDTVFKPNFPSDMKGSPIAVIGLYTRIHNSSIDHIVSAYLRSKRKLDIYSEAEEIEPDDLKKVFKRLPLPIDEAKIDSMVDSFTINENGKINIAAIQSLINESAEVNYELSSDPKPKFKSSDIIIEGEEGEET